MYIGPNPGYFSLIPAVYRDLKICVLVKRIRRFLLRKIQPIPDILENNLGMCRFSV